MSEKTPLASFDEVRALLAELPGPDWTASAAAVAREAQLTKPAGALGRLEELSVWLATWQGRHPPRMERPHTAVFAGNHGVAAQGVSAYPAEVTRQMVANFIEGGAAVNQLCAVADSALRVHEMGLEEPTRDFSEAPAMDEADCAKAIAYGMMTVEDGLDVLALGEMGIANTTSAAAICHALFGGLATDWVGRGTGVDEAGLARKAQVVEAFRQGRDVIIKADVQGAATIKGLAPEATFIFLAPPNMEELACRLRQRLTESPEALRLRLETAALEMQQEPNFDYVVVNHQNRVEEAVEDIDRIVAQERRSSPLEGSLFE